MKGWLLVVGLAVAGAAACEDQPIGTGGPAPTILTFTAARGTITSGTSTTLRAVFDGGTGTIDHGVGAVTSGVLASTGILTATTPFTLTVANDFGSVHATVTVTVVAAAQLTVSGLPSPIAPGTPATLTVTALDESGNLATRYTGTIHFSSNDPFPATLPDDYTFVAADQGVHIFVDAVTLFTTGVRTVTATDAANALTASQTVLVKP